MSYTLRIESNAYEADGGIAKVLNALQALKKSARGVLGVTSEEFQGNQLRELYGVNQRVFERAMDWADQDFDRQIEGEFWAWKGPDGRTRRKNGQVVTELRDIVDTGELLRSKQRRGISSSIAEFEWTAEHAEGVHDGYTLKSGGINPPRPWTEPTLMGLDNVVERLINNGGK